MNLNATLIIEVVSFVILWAVLVKLFYKPILKFLDQRKSSVENWLNQAAKDKEAAQEALAQAREQLDKAKDEALKVKEIAKVESEELRHSIISQAKQEYKDLIAKSEAEINQKINEAKKELKKEIADISIDLTCKILEREIKKSDQERLIKESIKEI